MVETPERRKTVQVYCEDGMNHQDVCVFDRGHCWMDSCGYAGELALAGKTKTDCVFYKEIKE